MSGNPAASMASATNAPSRGHMYEYVSLANCMMSVSFAAMIAPWLSICVLTSSSDLLYRSMTFCEGLKSACASTSPRLAASHSLQYEFVRSIAPWGEMRCMNACCSCSCSLFLPAAMTMYTTVFPFAGIAHLIIMVESTAPCAMGLLPSVPSSASRHVPSASLNPAVPVAY